MSRGARPLAFGMQPCLGMKARNRDQVESLIGELVYARVLLALEREQLRRRDETLRERLDALLTELPGDQRWQVCETALERAWARAEREVHDESDGSGDLAA